MSTCDRRRPRITPARRRGVTSGFLLCAAVSLGMGIAFAQEGHPLVGTWRGNWGPTATQRHDLTVVMEYDGKEVTGVINPGFESMRLRKVTLDPATWTVRVESEARDARGTPVPVVIQAKFEDLTNRHRSLVGTWTQGATKGDFRITLD